MTTATSMAAPLCVALSLLAVTVLVAPQVSADDAYASLSAGDRAVVNEIASELLKGTRTFKRKSAADPNFLRFGKRSAGAAVGADDFPLSGREPNFLRFGKRAEPAALNNNFLRFGRSVPADDAAVEPFERESRQPNHNFLRFG